MVVVGGGGRLPGIHALKNWQGMVGLAPTNQITYLPPPCGGRGAKLRMMRKVGRGTASGAAALCCCRQRRQRLASMVMLGLLLLLLLEVLVLLMRRLLLGVATRRRERHLVVRERQRQL